MTEPIPKGQTIDDTFDGQEMVGELVAMGLRVHVELAQQRILNRRLRMRLAELEKGTLEHGGQADPQ